MSTTIYNLDMKQEFVQKLIDKFFTNYNHLVKSSFLRTLWLWVCENQLSTDYGMGREWIKREDLVLDEWLVH